MKPATQLLILLALACSGAGAAEPAPPAKSTSAAPPPHPLRNISPRAGFSYFTGYEKNNHNHPAIFAHQSDTQKLVVAGRGYWKEFPISQADQAFAAYRTLLKNNKYRIDDPAAGASPLMPSGK